MVEPSPDVETELPLAGGMGSGGAVVRVGDTVRRPIRPQSEAVALFLRHLEAVGFEGAPRHLGADDRGREVLTWIEGDVGVPPFPAWVADEQLLLGVARLQRALHQAASTFVAAARRHLGSGEPARARAVGHRLPQRPLRRERGRQERRRGRLHRLRLRRANRPTARHRHRGAALGADARSGRPGSRAAAVSTSGPASVRSAMSTALTRRSVSSLSTTWARSSTERWCRCGPARRRGRRPTSSPGRLATRSRTAARVRGSMSTPPSCPAEAPVGAQAPPGVIAPIARNEKISTSCTKWMNQAHAIPRVSSIDFARIQPRNQASATPTNP